jgi:AcrR family transcriptional regulator
VATGSVYRHFPSKTELVTELFRVTVGREVEAVAASTATAVTARDGVRKLVETFAGRAAQAPRLAYALLAEPVGPAVEAERLAYRRAFRDIAAGLIADGVASGELPDQDPELTAAALVGAVGEALVGPLAAQPHTIPRTIDSLVVFALRALGETDAGNP